MAFEREVRRMNRRNVDMLSGALFPNIIRYTVPIILTGLLQLAFNAADLVVVGQFRGSTALAAVGATGALTNLIINLFIGLSVGAGVTVAHGIGSRDDEKVHQTVHTALTVAVIGGLVLTVIGVSFSKQFLIWMGTPEDILPLSALYMKIYFSGMVFTMVYNFCGSILRAAGDTRSPLIFLSIAGVLNVLLNLFFVVVLGMNVEGVALATMLSQGVSAALVVWALMRRNDACRLHLKKLRIYPAQLGKIIQIGLPAGIQGSIFSISNVLIQSSINSFGDAVMSGSAAAGNIENFIYISMNAFHQTSVNFTGQNVGAHQWDRVRKTFLTTMGCVLVIGITLGSLALALGPHLLKIYITDSPEALAAGMERFQIICLSYFLCGMMDVATGALRGMGASTVPMITSILGVCGVRIAWIFTIFQIPRFHTIQCLFFSYTVSWAFTLGIHCVTYFHIYRKKSRQDTLSISGQL